MLKLHISIKYMKLLIKIYMAQGLLLSTGTTEVLSVEKYYK